MIHRSRAAAVAAALCMFVAGCSGGGSVKGKVTLDGEPLKSGVVTFHPVAGGPAAIGPVSESGEYELSVGTDKSIPPGDYVVTVVATQSAPYETQPPVSAKPPVPPKRITPDKYASKDTTDLKATVTAGNNSIPLELKSGK